MTTVRALRLGPGAVRALAGRCEGRVELAHPRGAYVRLDGDDFVHLVEPRGVFGPLSAVVAALPRLAPGERVLVALGDAREAVSGPWPPPGPARAARSALAAARESLPSAPTALQRGLTLLAQGDLEAATDALAGRGEGLTPAGDDVLAGFAGARAAAARPVSFSPRARGRSSPLGLAYLRCAERGELPEPAGALLQALVAGDAAAAGRRARRLAAWGASSGAALFWGMAAAGS